MPGYGQFGFGAGSLWAIPAIDITGAAIANPTPVPFAGLQEGTIEFSGTIKDLFGQNQFPLISLPGQKKITGKAKFGVISALALNLFFGETPAVGEIKVAIKEAGTPTGTPPIVTVAQHTTWSLDLGVFYALTGLPLTCVPATPGPSALGQYSVAAGVYTFYTGEANVLISYSYTTATAPGQVIPIKNHLLGSGLFFKAVLNMVVAGKSYTTVLNQCISNKLTMGTKLEDYLIPEMDFAAMDDGTGNVGLISLNN